MFVYPTPQYPRRPIEYVFKALYNLAGTVHIVSLVVLIADFYTRLKVSMPEYYTNSDLVIAPGIVTVLQGCVYRGSLRLGNVRATVDVSLGSIPYALMTTAQYITGLFVLEFLFIVNNFVCLFNYTTGNRHLRLCGVHVPLYHITVTFGFVYSLALIVLTWSFDVNRRFYERGLQYCADDLRARNATQLLESEYVGGTIFSTAVYWPFAASCFGVAVYTAGAIVLAVTSSDRAAVLLSEADAPWEARGPLCTTSKPLLRLHTAQRNDIIADAHRAMAEGERVRIVRSYHLMTETDFDKLVQAMREQVAAYTKEAQFERLRENFGDRVSQIDEGSFVWRHDLPSAPLSPDSLAAAAAAAQGDGAGGVGAADELVDVDFDTYIGSSNNNNNNKNNNNSNSSTTRAAHKAHTSGSGGTAVMGELSSQQAPPPPPPQPRRRRRAHDKDAAATAADNNNNNNTSQLFSVYSDHDSSVIRVADAADSDDSTTRQQQQRGRTRRTRPRHHAPHNNDVEGDDGNRRAHHRRGSRSDSGGRGGAGARRDGARRATVEDEAVPADALSEASVRDDGRFEL